MKSLNQYLTENQKTYTYRLSACKRLQESDVGLIKRVLDKYDVQSVADLKTFPIQDKHPDFPQCGPVETSSVIITVKYPTTPEIIAGMVAQTLGLDQSRVIARTPIQDANMAVIALRDSAALTSDMAQESVEAKKMGTQDQVDSLKSAHESKPTNAPKGPKLSTTDELPINSTSPIGSKQNKLPEVKSASR